MANKLIQLKDGTDNVFSQTDINVSPTVVYKKDLSPGTSDVFNYNHGVFMIVAYSAFAAGKYCSMLMGYGNGTSGRTTNQKLTPDVGIDVEISNTNSEIIITNQASSSINVTIIKFI